MSSSVIIDWEQLAAAERDRCLGLQQEFLEARAHARRLARRCAVARAVTGTRIGVPDVATPGIEEGSAALAAQLDSVRERLAAVETQLEESARTYARERAAARPGRGTAVPRPGATTTATDQLAAWRARENERQRALDDATADRSRAEAAERAAIVTLERAAELARALPGRADEVHAAARGMLAGTPGAQESFARLSAAARETSRAERAREEATLLRERIVLVTEQVAAARHPAAGRYADTLRARTDGCGEDPAALTAALGLAQEVLGRLTAAESRAELVAAVHEAMGEVWSLTDAPDGTAAVGGAAAARGDAAVLVPLPDTFPHHAVRFDVDGADTLTAEVVRLPGGDPAADRAAQEQMCGDMDELTERLATRGFATRWREQAPAGAFPAAAAGAGDAATEGGRSTAEETARAEQERAAAVSRARAAAPRQAASRPTGSEGGRR
jgi:hypothetical protein